MSNKEKSEYVVIARNKVFGREQQRGGTTQSANMSSRGTRGAVVISQLNNMRLPRSFTLARNDEIDTGLPCRITVLSLRTQ